MRGQFHLSVLLLTLAAAGVTAQASPPSKELVVKEITRPMAGTYPYAGIVGAIDADSMTLVVTSSRGEVKEYVFTPIDLLRKGKVLPKIYGGCAYRWQDVKAGDRVEVEVMQDPKEKVTYCVQIMIERRPKDKLPKSQRPDDDWSFAARSTRNDIDNGLDVTDEEIKKVWPAQKEVRNSQGNLVRPASAGGLDKEYQAKLDAIRAKKKEGDPKAPPPEKK